MEIKEMTGAMEKMNVVQHDGGAGGVTEGEKRGGTGCLCKESCSELKMHSWSKVCVACGCSSVDHAPGSDADDDQRMGRLLTDSPCSHLTAKVKGAGGLRLYKRNRMTVTNPVVTRKDPSFNTTYYDWTPFGLTQKLAMQYMQDSLPENRRPISGTEGVLYRRRQLLGQLPVYDQDPMKCQSLTTSEEEISSMLLFVKGYKQEVLGVGEVALPTEGGALAEAANQRKAKETKDQGSATNSKAEHPAGSTNGTRNPDIMTEYFCTGCHGEITSDSLVVYAERAGYHDYRWHPGCFLCSECGQGLVDLVYFWTNQKLLCGRHYCQSVWPRCSGCDELIFCQSFHSGTDGRTWHHDHYCCWRCGQSLDTPCVCSQ